MELHAPLAVEATALVKTYGGTTAVGGLDLVVPAGTIHGVLDCWARCSGTASGTSSPAP
ncbi:hypothetical protein ABC795_10000 [Blastococcus sp. HT6-30]|uniref:hypothetical protein n=1 Tax=Blastococcus sp. HT6-30 TaxID=3144843 RepID=UPI00321ACCB7